MQYSHNSFNGQKENRRQSFGTLVSPEIDMGTAGSTAEQDGFYLLKKDSQRRTTLAKVLAHDQSTLCKTWMSFIRKEFGQSMLINEHLELLMKGLQDYITDQNKIVVEQTINNLKEQLNFDLDAVHQLHFSLYFFQDAAKSVLRRHNIKPHWMFALDNLVHSAVQAAITVLKPEFEDNLAPKDTKPEGSIFSATTDDMKNSSPSFCSSIKSHKTDESCYLESSSMKSKHELHRHTLMFQAENHRLLEEVLECQKLYNKMLKKILEDQKDQMCMLKLMVIENTAICGNCCCREYSDFDFENSSNSKDLIKWLRDINIDEQSIKKIVFEQFSLDQLQRDVTREDLKGLGLKRGVELRLWKDIERYRVISSGMMPSSTNSSEDISDQMSTLINNNNA